MLKDALALQEEGQATLAALAEELKRSFTTEEGPRKSKIREVSTSLANRVKKFRSTYGDFVCEYQSEGKTRTLDSSQIYAALPELESSCSPQLTALFMIMDRDLRNLIKDLEDAIKHRSSESISRVQNYENKLAFIKRERAKQEKDFDCDIEKSDNTAVNFTSEDMDELIEYAENLLSKLRGQNVPFGGPSTTLFKNKLKL